MITFSSSSGMSSSASLFPMSALPPLWTSVVMVINLIPMCMWTYTWVHWTYKLNKSATCMWQQEELQQWKSQSGFPPRLSMKTMISRFFLAGYYFFYQNVIAHRKLRSWTFSCWRQSSCGNPFYRLPFCQTWEAEHITFWKWWKQQRLFISLNWISQHTLPTRSTSRILVATDVS